MTARHDLTVPSPSAPAGGRAARARKPRARARPRTGKPHAGLASDLARLHAEWRGALATHRLHNEARFLELRRALAGKGARLDLGEKQARKLHDALLDVRLKPKKGRLRDLRTVDHLLKQLLRRVRE